MTQDTFNVKKCNQRFYTEEAVGQTSSFILFKIIYHFFLKFQALSDANICMSKYCTIVSGPRIKPQKITHLSEKSNIRII